MNMQHGTERAGFVLNWYNLYTFLEIYVSDVDTYTLSVTDMTLLLEPVPGVSEEEEELDMVEIGLPEMVLPRERLLANDCTSLS